MKTKTVLCLGDSNTYGYNPRTGGRYSPAVRWTCRLQQLLGSGYTVIGEGCNGRTALYVSDYEPWKTGRPYLLPCLNTHKPVDLVIIMLGTNDLKADFHPDAAEITVELRGYITDIRRFSENKQLPVPRILLIAPPPLGENILTSSPFAPEFDGHSRKVSAELGPLYQALASEEGVHFLDMGKYVSFSEEDSLHMTEEGHRIFAETVSHIILHDIFPGETEGAGTVAERSGTVTKAAGPQEIPITSVGPVSIGQTENPEAATGCTVFLSKEGMRAGLDIRGGGPASRESQLLNPLMAAQTIHGIVIAGGSAFGLNAAGGVMQYLEEQGIGFDVGVTKVPLVAQSDIFDLTVGSAFVRPDAAMGYEAAKIALTAPNYRDGNYGAGCGATVGKIAGMERCMKSGIGSYAIALGELKIGAVAVVNALGDIYDWKTGAQIAGLLTEDRTQLISTSDYMKSHAQVVDNRFADNTTIAVVLTNGYFEKMQLCKIAGMAHDGYARSIRPVHTSADGDSIYAVSVGDVPADRDLTGLLAAEVVSEAITRAVRCAKSAYDYKSAGDLA